MALNKDELRDLMIVELNNRGFGVSIIGDDNTNWLYPFLDAISTAIVNHIIEKSELIATERDIDGAIVSGKVK